MLLGAGFFSCDVLMESCNATLRTRVASHGAIQQYLNSHNHNNTKVPILYATENGIVITEQRYYLSKKYIIYNQITTHDTLYNKKCCTIICAIEHILTHCTGLCSTATALTGRK